MRKLKNQKRLSRSIEKIFISKKEERPQGDFNQDPLLIKPKKELLCPPAEAAVFNGQVEAPQASAAQPAVSSSPEAQQDTQHHESENQGTKDNQG